MTGSAAVSSAQPTSSASGNVVGKVATIAFIAFLLSYQLVGESFAGAAFWGIVAIAPVFIAVSRQLSAFRHSRTRADLVTPLTPRLKQPTPTSRSAESDNSVHRAHIERDDVPVIRYEFHTPIDTGIKVVYERERPRNDDIQPLGPPMNTQEGREDTD